MRCIDMEKMRRLILICALIISLVFIGIIIYVLIQGSKKEVSYHALEECEVLEKNNENGLNILFFAKDKNEAERYIDYFLSFNPFDKYKDRFNFYYIGNYYPECEVYKGIALLCYSRDLIKKAASCPNDHIVVLNGDYDRSMRSSNYLNVLSINTKHPLSVFAHEFGHSFVNLAEEYVPAKIPRNSAGNCAADCIDFQGRNDGCFEGCSRGDYFRSVDNGIMRTLQADHYGSFSEWVITNKILEMTKQDDSVISGRAIDEERDCSKEKYLLVGGHVEDGDILIDEKSIQRGCSGGNGEGEFSSKIVLEDGSEFDFGGFHLEIYTDVPGVNKNYISSRVADGDRKEVFMADEVSSDDGNIIGRIFRKFRGDIFTDAPKEGSGNEGDDAQLSPEDASPAVGTLYYAEGKENPIYLRGSINGLEDKEFRFEVVDEEKQEVVVSEPVNAPELLIEESLENQLNGLPFEFPSESPSKSPSISPSGSYSASPSVSPSSSPSALPSGSPSESPKKSSSASPSSSASGSPIGYSGGGSFFQKLTGWIGKTITGWFGKLFD